MVLTRILSQQTLAFLFSLSLTTTVILGTYTLSDLFNEFEDPHAAPHHLADITTSAIDLPYGGRTGELASEILESKGGTIFKPEEDPHDTGTHIIEFDKFLVVTARGCRFNGGTIQEIFLDIWVNAKLGALPIKNLTGDDADRGFVHRGYAGRAESLMPAFDAFAPKLKEKPVLFLGHSMGGATMKMAGWMAASKLGLEKVIFISVGSPPVLSRTAAEAFSRQYTYLRIYDEHDPTPKLYEYPIIGIPFRGMVHPEGLEISSRYKGKDLTGGLAHGLENYAMVLGMAARGFVKSLSLARAKL